MSVSEPTWPVRVPLVAQRTPLVRASRLSSAVGHEIWFKRDDLTGLALGGNKARGLEFLLADALACGADCFVTGAGAQSNWAMMAGLAATTQGLEAHLVHYGAPVPAVGNLRLSRIVYGAHIRFTHDPERASVDGAMAAWAAELSDAGRVPYVVPRGGATPLGAVGYVRGALEIAGQLEEHGLAAAELWLATGSCGTQAGLVAGMGVARPDLRVVGVTVSRAASECEQRVVQLAMGAAALVASSPEHVRADVVDGFIGPGYGRASREGDDAARLVARTEGVFLDPVFGAKAMAALLARLRQPPAPSGPVVFLVSGGAPTLFTTDTDL